MPYVRLPGMIKTSITCARSLRKNQTEAEARLWKALRNRQIHGHKFVRQFPINQYIVDFCCRKAQLVVEVDGGQHNTQLAYDEERTVQIELNGYVVVRFWNNEVLSNLPGVLEQIAIQLNVHSVGTEKPSP